MCEHVEIKKMLDLKRPCPDNKGFNSLKESFLVIFNNENNLVISKI